MFQYRKASETPSPQVVDCTFRQNLEKALESRQRQQHKRFGVYLETAGPKDLEARCSTSGVLDELLPAQPQRLEPRSTTSLGCSGSKVHPGHFVLPPFPSSADDSELIRSVRRQWIPPRISELFPEELFPQESELLNDTAERPMNEVFNDSSSTTSLGPSDAIAEPMPPTENSSTSDTQKVASDNASLETTTSRVTADPNQEENNRVEGLGECNICFTNWRDHVTVPCGHLYCSGCVKQQLEKGACFICNREVIMTVKIFL